LDEFFKSKIIAQVEDLFEEFLYIRKFLIFKFKIKLIVNNIENIEIIEKNYLNFNEIDFYQGIIDNKGIDLNKILKNIKGIMKYNNGDVYIGSLKDGKKEGKGVMIYKNGEIVDGLWENDIKKKYITKYNNSKIIKYYEQIKDEELDKNDLNDIILNDNDLSEFIKKIDLTTQFCQLHKNLIIGLCIDKDCKEKNKLLCQKCLFREHKKHDIIEIEEYNDKFKENIIKGVKVISELKDMNQNKNDKEIDLKISNLKLYINELFKENIESFISSIFQKIIKGDENFLNQKKIKLKNNFPIDNLDKQVEISNLVSSLTNMNINFNDKIEPIKDILNIKFENIKNEIKEIFSVIFDNKDSSIYEIENYWTKETFESKDNKSNYELEENNCLAKRKYEGSDLIKSKLKLREGNKYIFLFNIINKTYMSNFAVGFINNELLQIEQIRELPNGKGTIYLSDEGLYIDGIKSNENIKIENEDEICFILVLKGTEKYLILFKNGKYIGKFHYNLTDFYAFAWIKEVNDSVKIKSFIEL